MTFHCSRTVKGRKQHRCEQCGTVIPAGEMQVVSAGSNYGDFYSYRAHVECEDAGKAYATMTGYWGEEYTWFQHHDSEIRDWQWMVEDHPIVAARLGWDKRLSEWQKDMTE